MNIEQIQLSERGTLTALLHEKSNEMKNAAAERLAVILCPGGAYSFCSDRECDPPAIAFLNMGCQVFVLRYSVEPYAGNKRPLQEVAASVKIVRERADRWQVDKHKIVVCGFSAGGHLAASLGVHWNDPDIMRRCEVKDAQMLRPDAMILGYPVITAGIFAHRESIQRVSQDCHEDECYDTIGNAEYETERLRRLFTAFECTAECNAELLLSTVSAVLVTRQAVRLQLKNGQIIGKDDLA